jgi:hypothetical protein
MTRWKAHPLKCSGMPADPAPFSPVHSARKFCAWEIKGDERQLRSLGRGINAG